MFGTWQQWMPHHAVSFKSSRRRMICSLKIFKISLLPLFTAFFHDIHGECIPHGSSSYVSRPSLYHSDLGPSHIFPQCSRPSALLPKQGPPISDPTSTCEWLHIANFPSFRFSLRLLYPAWPMSPNQVGNIVCGKYRVFGISSSPFRTLYAHPAPHPHPRRLSGEEELEGAVHSTRALLYSVHTPRTVTLGLKTSLRVR
jgi:hypothetical protein